MIAKGLKMSKMTNMMRYSSCNGEIGNVELTLGGIKRKCAGQRRCSTESFGSKRISKTVGSCRIGQMGWGLLAILMAFDVMEGKWDRNVCEVVFDLKKNILFRTDCSRWRMQRHCLSLVHPTDKTEIVNVYINTHVSRRRTETR